MAGLAVLDIGLVSTPALYFATRVLGADGGIMVTGSHNPAHYNGFKMVVGKAPFWGKALQDLGQRARSEERRVGKECAVRVEPGGRPSNKKKTTVTNTIATTTNQ